MTVSDSAVKIGELSLIRHIRSEFSSALLKDVAIGIGDDAAVLRVGGREGLLISADTMCEGIHFDMTFATAYQVGFKLVSVNVSDIYAMGGTPNWFLLTAAFAPDTSEKFAKEFLSGVKDALDLYGAGLVGGDITSSKSGIVVTGIVMGFAEKPITRSGARVGDKIYVTGALGDSACGLELLRHIMAPVELDKDNGPDRPMPWPAMRPLIHRHLMPIVLKPSLGASAASAMMDISDGLALDLRRLCAESGVGAVIYENKLPMSSHMLAASELLDKDPLHFSLCGGEDYEYLFTSAEDIDTARYIGDITDTGLVMIDKNNDAKDLADCGYVHFI
ncbi:MAG: thiamine-phosphate kinase [Candidatus Magnetominusculus sp. LBB02]|nr:thiamine-phosphate kinase [Candidatus Magnetominusculus sp. LBB02]